jgi:hypothetical protein
MDQTKDERDFTLTDADSEIFLGDSSTLLIELSDRDDLLGAAKELVNGDREDDYGEPLENHRRIAGMWSAITGHEYTPEMVALMMIGLKLARLSRRTNHFDSWVDVAGYAALGWEMASREPRCKTHPDAPHGFDRVSSHSEGRYVCECESWEPDHALALKEKNA